MDYSEIATNMTITGVNYGIDALYTEAGQALISSAIDTGAIYCAITVLAGQTATGLFAGSVLYQVESFLEKVSLHSDGDLTDLPESIENIAKIYEKTLVDFEGVEALSDLIAKPVEGFTGLSSEPVESDEKISPEMLKENIGNFILDSAEFAKNLGEDFSENYSEINFSEIPRNIYEKAGSFLSSRYDAAYNNLPENKKTQLARNLIFGSAELSKKIALNTKENADNPSHIKTALLGLKAAYENVPSFQEKIDTIDSLLSKVASPIAYLGSPIASVALKTIDGIAKTGCSLVMSSPQKAQDCYTTTQTGGLIVASAVKNPVTTLAENKKTAVSSYFIANAAFRYFEIGKPIPVSEEK